MKTTALILVLLLAACGGGDPDPCPGYEQRNATGQCVEPISSTPATPN